MKAPMLIVATIAVLSTPAIAEELTLEDVRAMSDQELYVLAETLSAEDETRLYQQARKVFPEGALGLQSVRDRLEKREEELEVCERAIETGEPSDLRALNEREPGRYFDLLRIVANPTENVMDMTVDERTAAAKDVGSKTNRLLRDLRQCKREYRKKFGSD